ADTAPTVGRAFSRPAQGSLPCGEREAPACAATIDKLLKFNYNSPVDRSSLFCGVRPVAAARLARPALWKPGWKVAKRRASSVAPSPPQGLLTLLACGRALGLVAGEKVFYASHFTEEPCVDSSARTRSSNWL